MKRKITIEVVDTSEEKVDSHEATAFSMDVDHGKKLVFYVVKGAHDMERDAWFRLSTYLNNATPSHVHPILVGLAEGTSFEVFEEVPDPDEPVEPAAAPIMRNF